MRSARRSPTSWTAGADGRPAPARILRRHPRGGVRRGRGPHGAVPPDPAGERRQDILYQHLDGQFRPCFRRSPGDKLHPGSGRAPCVAAGAYRRGGGLPDRPLDLLGGPMANLGFTEIMLIMVVVLLLFGAKRLPEVGASIGKGIREFKRSLSDTQDAIMGQDDTQRNVSSRPMDASAPPTSGEPKRLSQ